MFKVGDTIVCIDTPELPKSLTVGKSYRVIRCGRLVDILNDKKWLHSYSKTRFVTVEQSRTMKLNRICSRFGKK